jgi:hypothetical protein
MLLDAQHEANTYTQFFKPEKQLRTFGGSRHIGIFNAQNKGGIRAWIVELSLFRHQPIVERRASSSHVQTARRTGRKAHSGRCIGGIFALEGENSRQFRSFFHCRLQERSVAKISVETSFALEPFDEGNARISVFREATPSERSSFFGHK